MSKEQELMREEFEARYSKSVHSPGLKQLMFEVWQAARQQAAVDHIADAGKMIAAAPQAEQVVVSEITAGLLEAIWQDGFDSEHYEDRENCQQLIIARNAIEEARAAPPTPDVSGLEFALVHPRDGERHSVQLSREEIQYRMSDDIYEKLGEIVCSCQPVGETNVVDCNCPDRIDEFEIVATQRSNSHEA